MNPFWGRTAFFFIQPHNLDCPSPWVVLLEALREFDGYRLEIINAGSILHYPLNSRFLRCDSAGTEPAWAWWRISDNDAVIRSCDIFSECLSVVFTLIEKA